MHTHNNNDDDNNNNNNKCTKILLELEKQRESIIETQHLQN